MNKQNDSIINAIFLRKDASYERLFCLKKVFTCLITIEQQQQQTDNKNFSGVI